MMRGPIAASYVNEPPPRETKKQTKIDDEFHWMGEFRVSTFLGLPVHYLSEVFNACMFGVLWERVSAEATI